MFSVGDRVQCIKTNLEHVGKIERICSARDYAAGKPAYYFSTFYEIWGEKWLDGDLAFIELDQPTRTCPYEQFKSSCVQGMPEETMKFGYKCQPFFLIVSCPVDGLIHVEETSQAKQEPDPIFVKPRKPIFA
jgi:hypothetical protein